MIGRVSPKRQTHIQSPTSQNVNGEELPTLLMTNTTFVPAGPKFRGPLKTSLPVVGSKFTSDCVKVWPFSTIWEVGVKSSPMRMSFPDALTLALLIVGRVKPPPPLEPEGYTTSTPALSSVPSVASRPWP